jgi:tRNA pseudouridine55 synthase
MTVLTKQCLDEIDQWREHILTEGAALLVDKDLRWTSFDVVAKLRRLLGIKKIGHAGTLDPLATGLLIVCCGKATKSIDQFQAQRKRYTATIRLGATTNTDDAEAPEEQVPEQQAALDTVTEEDLHRTVQEFVGEIQQVPPMFSALKHNGKPLYKLARQGKTVQREARTVTVHSITIVAIALPLLTVEVECSKGTYIRSLARDIGAALGCGGYLHSLRRTGIGEYNVEDALTVKELQTLCTSKT